MVGELVQSRTGVKFLPAQILHKNLVKSSMYVASNFSIGHYKHNQSDQCLNTKKTCLKVHFFRDAILCKLFAAVFSVGRD